MSVSGVSSQHAAAQIEQPAYQSLKSPADVSAKNAMELHMKVTVAVMKEMMEAEKAMAAGILDMLV